MHVLFVEPNFPSNQREFVRGLHRAGARITGIGERPIEYLDDEMKGWLEAYEQVRSVVHQASLLEAVQRCQARGWVDRLESTIEAHIMPTAHVREACGIPGTSVQTSYLCRDKPAMKEALRQAGIPTAQSDGVNSPEEVRAFIQRVGLPIVIKPRDAAGAAGTYKISKASELDRILAESGVDRGQPAAVEEFIEGHEGFYDTICVDGRPVHEFACHYYPNVLGVGLDADTGSLRSCTRTSGMEETRCRSPYATECAARKGIHPRASRTMNAVRRPCAGGSPICS